MKIVLPAEEVKKFFEQKWSNEQSANAKLNGEEKQEEKFESLYNYTNPIALKLSNILVVEKKSEKKGELLKILDLGSGDGRNSLLLAVEFKKNNIYAKIEAEDFSRTALKRLNKRRKQLKLGAMITTQASNIEKRKYNSEEYNAITCCNTLHYWNEKDLKEIIKNLQISTKKKGYNYISFECEIDMALIDGQKFIFANQPNYTREQIEKFLTKQYKNWKIVKTKVSRVEMEPFLPESTQKLLQTNEQKYSRTFTLFEILAQKI